MFDMLNDALACAGRRLGFDGKLAITGLASLADVKSAKDDLQNGDRSLDDLLEFAMKG